MEKSGQFLHHSEGYKNNAWLQRDIVINMLPTLKGILDTVSASNDKVFTVCDYGAADGSNSLPAIKLCREYLDTSYGKNKILSWVFNDLPHNDFGAVFQSTEEHFENCHETDRNILTLASGKSFYEKVLPDDCVDLGICFNAAHWLSERSFMALVLTNLCPNPKLAPWVSTKDRGNQRLFQIQNKLRPEKGVFSTKETLTSRMKEIGQRDWTKFLLLRAKELKPGGQLFVIVTNKEDRKEGRFNSQKVRPLALQRLFDEGLLSEEEVWMASNAALLRRSEQEVRFPFEQEPGLPVVKAGLRLVSLEHHKFQDNFVTEWENAGQPENIPVSETSIRKMVSLIKSITNTHLSVLASSRDGNEYERLLEKYYYHAEAIIRDNPMAFDWSCTYFSVHIEKLHP